MNGHTHEEIYTNEKVRDSFLAQYERFVELLMKGGHIAAGLEHRANLKRMKEALT